MCTDLQNQNDLFLNSDEIDLLCKLVVNFIIRHPVSLNIFDFQNVIKYIKELEMGRNIYSLFRELDFGSADSIFEAAFKKYMLTEGKENDHFPQILKKEIMQLSFFFIYAKESEFITSDIPVVTIEDDSNNKFIYFVLTPKVAVVFENYIYFKKNRIIEIDANRVDNINKELIEMQTNKKFLICRTEDILKKYINRGEK